MKLYKSGSINTAKKRHNFRFTKSLGQNFLTDINIINAIIESSLIDEKSLVVEIGPGMGALTEGLTEVAGHVTAIEIDKNLIPVLEENFRDIKNFSLIQGDVLKVDIKKLIEVLNTLVEQGNTVIVIEHNLDMIKIADHIIDLGVEGGDGGGTIVITGTPEEVAKCEKSYTGQFLRKILGEQNG